MPLKHTKVFSILLTCLQYCVILAPFHIQYIFFILGITQHILFSMPDTVMHCEVIVPVCVTDFSGLGLSGLSIYARSLMYLDAHVQ